MELFWDIFYWLIPIWVFFMIPFMTFYYEADDGTLMAGTHLEGKKRSRLASACCYQLVILFVMGLTLGLCYAFLNKSYVPIETYIVPPTVDVPVITINKVIVNSTTGEYASFSKFMLGEFTGRDDRLYQDVSWNSTSEEVIVPVEASTFFAGFMAFIGWFFFAIFGGIGLAALPLDLIMAYVRRPKFMDAGEFAEAQISIRERVNELVSVGELMKLEEDEGKTGAGRKGLFNGLSKDAREQKKTFLDFRRAVYLLEEDIEEFQNCSANYKNYNPLIPYFSLILGVCAVIISLFWLIHIIVYVLPKNPILPFLNTYFKWFDSWFPLFGVLSVAIFTLYLLLCAIKGCFKFGMRVGFVHLHPMKLNKTYMSSFMFNIGLVLLCSLPVVQFCSLAFADYARYTNTLQIMGTQVKYLKFFSFFWKNNVFVYILIIFGALSSLYLICRPRDAGVSSLDLRDRLRSRARSHDE